MADKGARNDLSAAVPKFCLALEEHRRTGDGRVRTSQEFLAAFFPHDDKASTDKLFKHMPNEVRGPIVAAWGIRGVKAALRDDDAKIQQVVHDAVVAGDVDHQTFEDGVTPETLVRWVPLAELWAFWRGGKLTKQAIHKALATAYELYLFDARWFLDALSARGGALKGTDVLADGLSKDDLTHWVRRIYETADGTPKGIVASLGWDKIVAKTANEVLMGVLDAVVTKVGLVMGGGKDSPPRAADSTPRLAESGPKLAEPTTQKAADTAAKPGEAGTKLEPKAEAVPPPAAGPIVPMAAPSPVDPRVAGPVDARPTHAPTADDGSWSMPPTAPEPSAADDGGINVVVDDEMLTSGPGPITAQRMAAAGQVPPDDEPTEVKASPRRSERPPGRGGPRSSR